MFILQLCDRDLQGATYFLYKMGRRKAFILFKIAIKRINIEVYLRIVMLFDIRNHGKFGGV